MKIKGNNYKCWETNKINKFGNQIYELHFTEFYDDEILLVCVKDEREEDTYCYQSPLLNVEDDSITADSIEDAMEQFEEMIIEKIEEDIDGLEMKLNKFKNDSDEK